MTFNVVPGTNATCVAVTETLPPGIAASNITAGGSYVASNNAVMWGPFFGTNTQILSFQAVGVPGTYPAQTTWSVDGTNASQTTNIVIASPFNGGVPTPPQQVAAPTFTPPSGSGVPTNVTIACATPGTMIYYTLDGSLPTQNSTLYAVPIYLSSPSTLRAIGFTNSIAWTPSAASVAYYGPTAAPANAQLTVGEITTNPRPRRWWRSTSRRERTPLVWR